MAEVKVWIAEKAERSSYRPPRRWNDDRMGKPGRQLPTRDDEDATEAVPCVFAFQSEAHAGRYWLQRLFDFYK